ncbi:hypothetical protein BaRGS_00002828, partial [Batillaria attramentaria]
SATCNLLDSANLPATAQANIDSIKTLCTAKTTDAARCQVLEAFAVLLKKSFTDLYGSNHNCRSCTERERNICDSNCLDFSFPFCKDEGKYYRDGRCVDQMNCGCYDLNTTQLIEPGDKETNGCTECTCTGYQMECEQACEQVYCAAGQTAYDDLKLEGPCARRMCPDRYDITRKCVEEVRPNQQCFCGAGLFETYEDKCVEKCPCYESGSWFDHGYSYNRNCKQKTCNDGIWDITEDDSCTGSCILSGSPLRIKPFDQQTLTDKGISGKCSYTFFNAGGYEIMVKAMVCGQNSIGCGHKITVNVPFLQGPVEIYRGMGGNVMYNGQAYSGDFASVSIVTQGLYVDVTFEDKITIRTTEGLFTEIIVKNGAFSDIKGMCGNFNTLTNDDWAGPDNNNVMSVMSAAEKWAEEPCASPEDTSAQQCEEGSTKQRWAVESCKVITEGDAFAQCRNEFATSDVQSTCESGGDCECMCDAIAAFAALCGSEGFPGRFRHQRLCPIQCDYGTVYESCGNACPETCSGAANDSCSNAPCVEGCFCPHGMVRADATTLVCVPKSECPCEVNGLSVSAGETVTIDCQTCQCENGEFNCQGDICERECEESEFECLSGQCVKGTYRCDSAFDCSDGSDEIGCISTNCTEFTCDNGMCIMVSEVCDGIRDCFDGKDEMNCDQTCADNEFQCSQGGCIPITWYCDKENDCPMGDDEPADCDYCPENYTHCNQTYCAPKDFFCDGHDDCGNGEDEIGCSNDTHYADYTTDRCRPIRHLWSYWLVSQTASESDVFVLELNTLDDAPAELIVHHTHTAGGPQSSMCSFWTKRATVKDLLTRISNSERRADSSVQQRRVCEDRVYHWMALCPNLVVKACYNPIATTTPTTPTFSTTPEQTTPQCYEAMPDATTTAENGDEDLTAVMYSTTDPFLQLRVDGGVGALFTQITLDYTNVESFTILTAENAELQEGDINDIDGTMTVTFTGTPAPSPIVIVLFPFDDSTPITAKTLEILGCYETVPTLTLCEDGEMGGLPDFSPDPRFLKNVDSLTPTDSGDVVEPEEPGTPFQVVYVLDDDKDAVFKKITYEVTGGEVLSVTFYVIDDEPLNEEEKVVDEEPGPGPNDVFFETNPVGKKVRVFIVPKPGESPQIKISEIDICLKVEVTTPPSPTSTSGPTPTTPATPCPYNCNGQCFWTEEGYCASECSAPFCETESTTTTSTIRPPTTPGVSPCEEGEMGTREDFSPDLQFFNNVDVDDLGEGGFQASSSDNFQMVFVVTEARDATFNKVVLELTGGSATVVVVKVIGEDPLNPEEEVKVRNVEPGVFEAVFQDSPIGQKIRINVVPKAGETPVLSVKEIDVCLEGPVTTGCGEEMQPEQPPADNYETADLLDDKFVQVTEFPDDDVFVESVPVDEDTEVFLPVDDDEVVDGVFVPTPGKKYVVITADEDTPLPAPDGTVDVDDLPETPGFDDVEQVPDFPDDDKDLTIFEVPEDNENPTPIFVGPNARVFEEEEVVDGVFTPEPGKKYIVITEEGDSPEFDDVEQVPDFPNDEEDLTVFEVPEDNENPTPIFVGPNARVFEEEEKTPGQEEPEPTEIVYCEKPQPRPVTTGCGEEMQPEQPPADNYETADLPDDKFVQVTEFPDDDVFVESVPVDDDTEVFLPVTDGVFYPKPGKKYVVITEEGDNKTFSLTDTPSPTQTTPAGTVDVDDLPDSPDFEDVEQVPNFPDDDEEVTIFEVPDDNDNPPPIYVGPNGRVFEEEEPPAGEEEVPVNENGPTTVITIDSKPPTGEEPEPTEFVYFSPCEEGEMGTREDFSPDAPFLKNVDVNTLGDDGFEASPLIPDKFQVVYVVTERIDATFNKIVLELTGGSAVAVSVKVIGDNPLEPEEEVTVRNVNPGVFEVVFQESPVGQKVRINVVPKLGEVPVLSVKEIDVCLEVVTTTPPPTTAPPTTVPSTSVPVTTGCAETMEPEEPDNYETADLPDDKFVQVSEFPDDEVFVESVPVDEDTEVFLPVDDDEVVDGVFTPEPGKKYIVITEDGDEPLPTPPGTVDVDDLPDSPEFDDVEQVPNFPNDEEDLTVFEVPEDNENPTPIFVGPNARVFEEEEVGYERPVTTGCGEEMQPEQPPADNYETADLPDDKFVQVTEFPDDDVFVESVPVDEDTEVFLPVDDDEVTDGVFYPKPGKKYVVITEEGETPSPTQTTPAGTVDVDDLPDSPDFEDVEQVPDFPDDDEEVTIFEVPDDNDNPPPIYVGPNGRVFEEQEPPTGEDEVPVNENGPTTVITIDSKPPTGEEPEPTEFVYCEKPGTTVVCEEDVQLKYFYDDNVVSIEEYEDGKTVLIPENPLERFKVTYILDDGEVATFDDVTLKVIGGDVEFVRVFIVGDDPTDTVAVKTADNVNRDEEFTLSFPEGTEGKRIRFVVEPESDLPCLVIVKVSECVEVPPPSPPEPTEVTECDEPTGTAPEMAVDFTDNVANVDVTEEGDTITPRFTDGKYTVAYSRTDGEKATFSSVTFNLDGPAKRVTAWVVGDSPDDDSETESVTNVQPDGDVTLTFPDMPVGSKLRIAVIPIEGEDVPSLQVTSIKVCDEVTEEPPPPTEVTSCEEDAMEEPILYVHFTKNVDEVEQTEEMDRVVPANRNDKFLVTYAVEDLEEAFFSSVTFRLPGIGARRVSVWVVSDDVADEVALASETNVGPNEDVKFEFPENPKGKKLRIAVVPYPGELVPDLELVDIEVCIESPEVTRCAEEMVPTEPRPEYYDTEDLPGNKVLQVTVFPDDVYVEGVPIDQDEDGQPDTKVFLPEEPSTTGIVVLEPGEKYIIVTNVGETTVAVPAPPVGIEPVDDVVDEIGDVDEFPVGDDKVVRIFETPDDGEPTPVYIGPNQSVLKEYQPEEPGDDTVPVESFGPTVVTIAVRPAGEEPEPTKITFCEKPATTVSTTPSPTTKPVTETSPLSTSPFTTATTAVTKCAEDETMEPLENITPFAGFNVKDDPAGTDGFTPDDSTKKRFSFFYSLGNEGVVDSVTFTVSEPVLQVVIQVQIDDVVVQQSTLPDVIAGPTTADFSEPGNRIKIVVFPVPGTSPVVEVTEVMACVK